MRRKLTEIELLKYWLDSEVTLIHASIGLLGIAVVHTWWIDLLIALYVVRCVFYATVRIKAVVDQQPDYLKVPPKL